MHKNPLKAPKAHNVITVYPATNHLDRYRIYAYIFMFFFNYAYEKCNEGVLIIHTGSAFHIVPAVYAKECNIVLMCETGKTRYTFLA